MIAFSLNSESDWMVHGGSNVRIFTLSVDLKTGVDHSILQMIGDL